MQRAPVWVARAALVVATVTVLWWLLSPQAVQDAASQRADHPVAVTQVGGVGLQASTRPMENSFFSARRAVDPDHTTDPLLVHGLRDTLEALLMQAQAGDVTDPATLKQRLAAWVGHHFPAALATRALALAERYVDYRVALGTLRTPQDLADPSALREALEARHKVRQQFFDGPEYDALFAQEADLDRYTLARLEIAHNTQLPANQRAQALRDAENELPEARRIERSTATQHLVAAAQTAVFNAQNTDERTRHAARSALYGDAAAHAMAQLDREEQHWQQRLDRYDQALSIQGDSAVVQQLRQQLFSEPEQQRVDAALALRRLEPKASGS